MSKVDVYWLLALVAAAALGVALSMETTDDERACACAFDNLLRRSGELVLLALGADTGLPGILPLEAGNALWAVRGDVGLPLGLLAPALGLPLGLLGPALGVEAGELALELLGGASRAALGAIAAAGGVGVPNTIKLLRAICPW